MTAVETPALHQSKFDRCLTILILSPGDKRQRQDQAISASPRAAKRSASFNNGTNGPLIFLLISSLDCQ